MGKKATILEREERVLTILEMVLKGANKPYIVRYASEKWEIGERMTEEYLSRAHVKIKELAEEKEHTMFAVTKARLEDLYRKNYTIEDFRECRNILADQRKMFGMDKPTKIDLREIKEQPLFPDVPEDNSDK